MPEPLDFETVRWKLADQMDEDDVKVLLENKDKLNDEEKDAFADILQSSEPLPENPLEHYLLDGEPEKTTEPIQPEVPEKPVVPETPIVPQTPAQPAQQGMTQEQMDSYLETKKKQWDDEGKTKAEQKEETEKLFDVFAKDEVPADWNAAVNKFAPQLLDAAEKRIMAKLEAKEQAKADLATKTQTEMQKALQTYEAEFDTLITAGKLPARTSPEFKAVHDAIATLGAKRNVKTITEAYTEYMQTPVEFGGGYKTGMDTTKQNAQIEAQKEAAGKIGSGKGVVKTQKGLPLWANIHNMSMDDLLEQRLSQPH